LTENALQGIVILSALILFEEIDYTMNNDINDDYANDDDDDIFAGIGDNVSDNSSTNKEEFHENLDVCLDNIEIMKKQLLTLKKQEKNHTNNSEYSDVNSLGNIKKGVRLRTVIITSVLCVIIGCFVGIFALSFFPTKDSSLLAKYISRYTKNDVVVAPQQTLVTIDGSVDSCVTAVYSKVTPSSIGIRVVTFVGDPWQQSEEVSSEGSGVVYKSDDTGSYIITNHHVIESAISDNTISSDFEIRIFLDPSLNQYFTANLIGYDEVTDLALLKISVVGLTPIEIVDSFDNDVQIGDIAIAIGCSGGLEYMNSVSSGVISGFNRTATTDDSSSYYELVQTSALINPGNSGGALVNSKGQLIGICVLKMVDSSYEGMGFAINSDTVKRIVSNLETGKIISNPYLGISVLTTYNQTVADQYNYPKVGAWVAEVVKDSPGSTAGLVEGDIIYNFNNVEISSFSELRKELIKYVAGDVIILKVYRTSTNEYVDISLTVGEK